MNYNVLFGDIKELDLMKFIYHISVFKSKNDSNVFRIEWAHCKNWELKYIDSYVENIGLRVNMGTIAK